MVSPTRCGPVSDGRLSSIGTVHDELGASRTSFGAPAMPAGDPPANVLSVNLVLLSQRLRAAVSGEDGAIYIADCIAIAEELTNCARRACELQASITKTAPIALDPVQLRIAFHLKSRGCARILKILLEHVDVVVPSAVMAELADTTAKTVRVHICNLRSDLADLGFTDPIQSIWGEGYLLTAAMRDALYAQLSISASTAVRD